MPPSQTASPPLNMAVRLAVFYGGYFLVGGVLFPFWPLLLEARGLQAGQIGLVLALALWLRAAAGPVVAWQADRSGAPKRTLIACAVAALAVMPAFYWAAGFWPLLLATFAFFFAYSSVGPLAETISLRTVSAEQGYGRVRLWGSVSFVVAAIAGGFLLDARGGLPASTIVTLLLVTLAILLAASLALPRPGGTCGARVGAVKNPAFQQAFCAFYSRHWDDPCRARRVLRLFHHSLDIPGLLTLNGRPSMGWGRGGGNSALCVRRAGGAPDGADRPDRGGGGSGCATLGGAGTHHRALDRALSQLLHAASFGAMHLGAMLFITRAVPDIYANSAQGLLGGLTYGAGLGAGMLLAGWLYGIIGADAYWANSALSALALLVTLWLAVVWAAG